MLEGVYRLTGDADERRDRRRPHARRCRRCRRGGDGDLALLRWRSRARRTDRPRLSSSATATIPRRCACSRKIGMAHDVLDDAEALLAAVLPMAPDHVAARLRLCAAASSAAQISRGARADRAPAALDPSHPDYRSLAATAAIGLGEQEPAIQLYRGLLDDAPGSADFQLWLGHALKTIGQVPEGDRGLSRRRRRPARFRRRLLEPRQPQDLPLRRRRDRANAAAEAAPATSLGRPHPSLLRARQGVRGSRRFRESWRYYARGNALKRAESRYRPEVFETNTRLQTAVCTPAFFADACAAGASPRRSDLHRRPAAIGLDAARADPRIALAGRGHAGASRHPARGARSAGPRARSRQSALSRRRSPS